MKEFFQQGPNKLAYTRTGNGKHRLIFLHGICGRREVWEKQTKFFAGNFEVVTFDLLGHGDSSDVAGQNLLKANLQTVIEFINRFPKPTTVIGHSLGGFLVNDLIGTSHSFDKYVFVDSPCLAKREDLERYHSYRDMILAEKTPKDFFRNWFSAFVTDRTSPAEKDLIINEAIDRNPNWMAEIMGSIDTPKKQTVTGQKILVIEGTQYFEAGNSISWLQHYPDASRWTYSGSGHYYFLDDPEPFNRALELFLK